jgi:iron complex outermembrane receptor protein
MRFIRNAPALLLLYAAAVQAQKPVELDTLHVQVGARTSATLPVAVRSVEVIDRAQIERIPAQTVADVLAWAQSVDVQARSPAQADLAIRGAAFEEVLVLVDGVRSSDVQTGHFDLDVAVPLDEVDRIEILRGPASAQYGSDAVGGVINIVTRRAGRPIQARLEGGSFSTASGSIGGSLGRGPNSVRWGAEHIRSDGSRSGTDHRITQARIGAGTPLGRGELRADAAFASRDFGAADFYAPFASYEETRTTTAAVNWARTLGNVALAPRFHMRRHTDDFILKREDPSFYRNRHTTWQLGGEMAALIDLGTSATAAIGVEGAQDRIDSNSLGKRRESRAAAFAEFETGRIGAGIVHAGLRTDWHETYGSFVAPSLAAAFWPAPAVHFRGAIGRSFRAPGWTERYYRDPANIGNPDLQPERSWSAELGVELRPIESIRLDLTAFLRSSSQLIDWARPADPTAATPFRTMNVEDAKFRGLEGAVRIAAWGALWSASGTVLSLEADESTGFISKYALRPLTQSASAGVSKSFGSRIQAGVQARHAKRRRVAGVAGSGEDGYFLLDARIGIAAEGVRFYLDATNLLDDEYLDVSVQPGPGRAFCVGIVWTPGQ